MKSLSPLSCRSMIQQQPCWISSRTIRPGIGMPSSCSISPYRNLRPSLGPFYTHAKRWFDMPKPTWSIASLELDRKDHPPISEQELQKLAKRALLDVDILEEKRRILGQTSLKQDLGNMMHLIQHVVETSKKQAEEQLHDKKDNPSTSYEEQEIDALLDAELYDLPRNISATVQNFQTNIEKSAGVSRTEQAKSVWENYLKTKTTRVGGHSYFVVTTSVLPGDGKK